jgi:hypothetical protein
MHQMREHLVLMDKLHYWRQQQRCFLEAVGVYCGAVNSLVDRLSALELRSTRRSRSSSGARPRTTWPGSASTPR